MIMKVKDATVQLAIVLCKDTYKYEDMTLNKKIMIRSLSHNLLFFAYLILTCFLGQKSIKNKFSIFTR